MMMGCAVAALMRGKELPRPDHKPLLMVDECAALGRLEALETGMGMLREYTHTVLVFQDLGQLRAIYGHDRATSFMAASGCQVTFGVSDIRTAQDLADDIGRTTVLARSNGLSEGNLDLVRAQHQNGRSEAGRYLIDPAEIRRLDSRTCIILMQDQVPAPIRAGKVRYYDEFCWHGLHDPWRGPAEVLTLPPPPPRGPWDQSAVA